MTQEDYYQILGLKSDAKAKDIKDAYRQLAFRYHPDRNSENPEAAEKMKAVNEAYAVLSDPSKRQEYDALRQEFGSSAYNQFRRNYSDQDIFNGSDINQIFEEMAKSFGLRGFDDIFKEFYGKGYHHFEFKGSGFFGGGFIFSGHPGRKKDPPALESSKGGFLGKLSRFFVKQLIGTELPEGGGDMDDVILLDAQLAREGGAYAYFHKKRAKKLVVKIPPGVRDGQRIRLAGMGEDGKGGGNPGDMYLKIRIKKSLIGKCRDMIFGK